MSAEEKNPAPGDNPEEKSEEVKNPQNPAEPDEDEEDASLVIDEAQNPAPEESGSAEKSGAAEKPDGVASENASGKMTIEIF